MKTCEAEDLAPSILGSQWNMKSNSLGFCRVMGSEVPVKFTQRSVSSQVSTVFDTLRLFSSFTVRMRVLLKGIRKKHGQSWDEELYQGHRIAFKDRTPELSHMKEMAIKRKCLSKIAEVENLHISADVHFSSLSSSPDRRAGLCSRKVSSSANEATVNCMTSATSCSVWDLVRTTHRRRTWYRN